MLVCSRIQWAYIPTEPARDSLTLGVFALTWCMVRGTAWTFTGHGTTQTSSDPIDLRQEPDLRSLGSYFETACVSGQATIHFITSLIHLVIWITRTMHWYICRAIISDIFMP